MRMPSWRAIVPWSRSARPPAACAGRREAACWRGLELFFLAARLMGAVLGYSPP
jgi:hypothetical protein